MNKKNKLNLEKAKKIGVSRPTYAQIESGARDMSVKEAQKLAQFFTFILQAFYAIIYTYEE
ncbi:helix-turn-helix transcriptional regulator [Patescibacteria group bacterium]|nr:helix-turn-helix transcriptional regulator [Patescibacteria group bacterium]